MGQTTTIDRIAREVPTSETHWRDIAARAHRARNASGDEAAARTHEIRSHEVRARKSPGSSREIRYCPACELFGYRYILLFMGGVDRCGSCGWDGKKK